MYNDQLLYKVVIWPFCGISLWTEKVDLGYKRSGIAYFVHMCCWIVCPQSGVPLSSLSKESVIAFCVHMYWLS